MPDSCSVSLPVACRVCGLVNHAGGPAAPESVTVGVGGSIGGLQVCGVLSLPAGVIAASQTSAPLTAR